jgi:NADPH:quinone reductase-like Zn-dependent oxidoreductase
VLGVPDGANKFDIRVEAFMAQPDISRLYALADAVANREFSIPTARTMSLKDAAEAHRLAKKGGVGGKIVLVP